MRDVEELLTVNEGAVEPLNVIVFREGEEDLVANNGEGKQEDGPTRHSQGESAQVHSANGIKQCGENSCAAIICLKNKSDWCLPNYLTTSLLLSCSDRPVLLGCNLTRLGGCDSQDWTLGTDHLLSCPHFTTSLKDLIN